MRGRRQTHWWHTVLLATLATACVSCERAPDADRPFAASSTIRFFPLSDVRLLDGSPFKSAERTNLEYVLAMDPDRLLAPYLREAGLEPKKPAYGNWEGSGLDGHIGGHYVSALALAWAATGDPETKRRLDTLLSELERAQEANGNGYLGGVPGSEPFWDEIRRGKIDADLFSLNDKWVPWYNVHKTFAGLRDAWTYAGSEQARRMLIDLADWAGGLVAGLDDTQVQEMLRTEHGGMNAVLADVAAITGDERYLDLARRFSHRQILDPLLAGEDRLDGLHANTQIPKVIGYQRIARLDGDESWANAAALFWDNVVRRRSVAIGGNSVREHFHPADDFSSMVEDVEGPETCNTYNMLKLSRLLYADSADPEYIAYAERALYNHILSSQHPEHGGLVYFTPMRPAHYRKYSQPELAMWCCVGSGIENHFRYGEFIYANRDRELFVNLFIPSRLDWQQAGIRLVQQTDFPDAGTVQMTIEAGSGRFTLHLRHPAWVADDSFSIAVNGQPVEVDADPGAYASIERYWQEGDTLTLEFVMATRLEQLPDGADYYAVLHGPVVLAARTPLPDDASLVFLSDDSRMGHRADGPVCPPEATPVMLDEPEAFLANLEPVAEKALTFRSEILDAGGRATVELEPFFRLHDTRYTLYWPTADDGLDEARALAERERIALDALTVDSVAPGEQQPEAEHGFAGEQTEAGVHRGRHWRHASGWFSYDLRDPDSEGRVLRVTYFGADAGRRFRILVDGEVLAGVELLPDRGVNFYDVDYPLPAEAGRGDGVLTVRFEAIPGSIAGGIYGLRLLRKDES